MIGYIIKCRSNLGVDEPVYDEYGRLYIFYDDKIAAQFKDDFINQLNFYIAGSPTKTFFGKEKRVQVKAKDLEKWELARDTMKVMTVNIEKMLSENED
jgi:hypothetical protein